MDDRLPSYKTWIIPVYVCEVIIVSTSPIYLFIFAYDNSCIEK